MTYFNASPAGPSAIRDREGPGMLLMDEALARSRQHEAQQAARDHALVRQLTAGRRWSWLAAFAARRAERARLAVR
ncbi:hypothetical protein GCM10017691_07510 [Pseudonocardia petroleophila]